MITEIKDDTHYHLALDAAKSIAEHYSQEIHLDDTSLPHFDPLHGKPVGLTRITKHWADKLHQDTKDAYEYIDIGQGLIESYCVHIRARCFHFSEKKNSFDPTAHVVLIQFERLLSSHLFSPYDDHSAVEDDAFEISNDTRTTVTPVQSIHSSIERLVFDIFSLTAIEKLSMRGKQGSEKVGDKEGQLYIVCNAILPTLLRILQHCIYLRSYILSRTQKVQTSEFDTLKYVLSITTFAALSFCADDVYNPSKCAYIDLSSANLDISELLPHDWSNELTLKHMFVDTSSFSSNILPTVNGEDSHIDNGLNYMGLNQGFNFINEPVINLNSLSANLSMPWVDHTTGIGLRAAKSLLQHLAALSLTMMGGDERIEAQMQAEQDESVLEIVVRTIGEDYAAHMVRSHFFGRLEMPNHPNRADNRGDTETLRNNSSATNSTEFNGISQIKRHSNDLDNIGMSGFTSRQKEHGLSSKRSISRDILKHTECEPFNEIPARIASTLRLLAVFKFPKITSLVWDHVLPIIFTLIDSVESHQSLGGSLLILFFHESTPNSFVSSNLGRNEPESVHNTTEILAMACRTCNEAVPLSILSKARCQLFEIITSDQDANQLRRETTFDTLNWIQKHSYCGPFGKTEALELLCGVLVGSLHPLLVQLAQLPDANAMELGRLGLSVLLPLIRWDSQGEAGRKIQYASVGCLISLMLGAYPVMQRHGGKIMAELVACVGRAQRDMVIHDTIQGRVKGSHSTENADKTREIAVTKNLLLVTTHAASITLILCGKRADEILVKVEEGNYSPRLSQWCTLLRSGAITMPNNEQEKKQDVEV